MNKKTIFIGGLNNSGKTFWILNSLRYWNEQQQKYTACKPFEINTQSKKINEQDTDGEMFAKNSNIKYHPTVHNLYSCSTNLPFKFASSIEGYKLNFKLLEKNYQTLLSSDSNLLIELLDSVLHPLVDDFTILSWLKQKTTKILWLLNINSKKILWNFSELEILKNAGFQINILLNNYQKNCDYSWIEYIWKELNNKESCNVLGLLPHLANYKFAIYQNIWNKIIN